MTAPQARLAGVLAWLARAIERGLWVVGVGTAWSSLILLIVVSVYDIVARRYYNTGSTRLQELEWHLFFALVMLSLGLACLRDDHVRIDILRARFSPRARAWIELAGWALAMVPFCAVVTYFGSRWAWRSYAEGEVALAAMGLPFRWIIKSALPVGTVLLFLGGLAGACRNALFLMGRAGDPGALDPEPAVAPTPPDARARR